MTSSRVARDGSSTHHATTRAYIPTTACESTAEFTPRGIAPLRVRAFSTDSAIVFNTSCSIAVASASPLKTMRIAVRLASAKSTSAVAWRRTRSCLLSTSAVAAWMRSLQSRLLADETGPVFEELARPDRRILHRILTEQPAWCDDVTSSEPVESCEAQVRLAYQDALDLLEARLGPDWRQWRWERLHRAPFGHPLYKFVPVLKDLVSLEVGTPGWDDTVNRGGASMGYERPESLFQHRHGPGLRAVYDLSDLENSRFMIAPGQSGNLFSSGYGNLVTRWRDGRALKLVGAATDRDRLLLLNPAQ